MQETPESSHGPLDPSADDPSANPGGEPAADIEQRLQQAEQAAAEHHEAWLRTRAEADNYRKRAQNEIANAHKYAVEGFASDVLPVKDSLEAALGSANAAVESLRSGVELTLRQLNSVFEKFNLNEIDPAGQKFDPHRHQAVSTVDSDAEPNTVVQVLQKGYLLNDRVIRPALVTVARAKAIET